jgi:hypothetical protein
MLDISETTNTSHINAIFHGKIKCKKRNLKKCLTIHWGEIQDGG